METVTPQLKYLLLGMLVVWLTAMPCPAWAQSEDTVTGTPSPVPHAPTITHIKRLPELPDQLKNSPVEGMTIFHVFVNHRGVFQAAEPVRASDVFGLDDYLRSWIRTWTFEPSMFNGFPVSGTVDITIQFNLPNNTFDLVDPPYLSTLPFEQLATKSDPIVTSESTPVKQETAEDSSPKETHIDTPSPAPEKSPDNTPAVSDDNQSLSLTEPAPEQPNQKVEIPDCSDKSQIDSPPEIIQPPRINSVPLQIQNLNLKGTAVFSVSIQTDGTVSHVDVITSSGENQLDEWLIPFLIKTFWEPASRDGQPVACSRQLTVRFYTMGCSFEFPDLFN
jgi:TonB family protein